MESNNEIKHYDLFEHFDKQPKELKEILDKFEQKFINGCDYSDLNLLLSELEKIGYVFEYGLDAVPFGLRPIGVELEQLQGWENVNN